ncbi:hypothetical protein NpNSSI1_00000973 [Neofusicoccum parvum]|nr:hypothetical protein NpNSSI1_00000973 [Neofusicoccum parvum]
MSSPEQFKSPTAENLCVYGVSNLSEQASSGEPLQRPNSPLPSPHSEASSGPSQSASTATVFQPPRPPGADVDIHRSDAAAPTPAVTSGSASSSEAAAAVSAARHAGTLTCTCFVAIACAVRDPEPGIPAAEEKTIESLLQLSNDELQIVDGFLACPYPHEASLDVLVYMLLHKILNALEKAVQKEAADAARRREILLGAQNIV